MDNENLERELLPALVSVINTALNDFMCHEILRIAVNEELDPEALPIGMPMLHFAEQQALIKGIGHLTELTIPVGIYLDNIRHESVDPRFVDRLLNDEPHLVRRFADGCVRVGTLTMEDYRLLVDTTDAIIRRTTPKEARDIIAASRKACNP